MGWFSEVLFFENITPPFYLSLVHALGPEISSYNLARGHHEPSSVQYIELFGLVSSLTSPINLLPYARCIAV
jgi:hypothetical protein